MCESGSIVHVQSVTQLCEVRLDLDWRNIHASVWLSTVPAYSRIDFVPVGLI
jgi:hypothetical protein